MLCRRERSKADFTVANIIIASISTYSMSYKGLGELAKKLQLKMKNSVHCDAIIK